MSLVFGLYRVHVFLFFLVCVLFVVTTSRLHGLLHQLVCFRRLPWALIPNTTQRPRCRKFGSIVPLDSAFSKPHGRRWRASVCQRHRARSCWLESRLPRTPWPALD